MAKLDALIAETLEWLAFHKSRKAKIEALACQIRLKALREAKLAVEG